MTSNFGDLFGHLFEGGPNPPENRKIALRQARAHCAEYGHRYRVYGKKNPTQIKCYRCLVSWAIGPRTEPKED